MPMKSFRYKGVSLTLLRTSVTPIRIDFKEPFSSIAPRQSDRHKPQGLPTINDRVQIAGISIRALLYVQGYSALEGNQARSTHVVDSKEPTP